MYTLTNREQVTLGIGVLLAFLMLISIIIIPSSNPIKIFFVGGITMIISIIVLYFFIFQPMMFSKQKFPRYRQSYRSGTQSFRPTVIPPSKFVKKTVTRGLCDLCEKPALMGFTCSYCSGYFCPEHRLPEKHGCKGITKL